MSLYPVKSWTIKDQYMRNEKNYRTLKHPLIYVITML